MPLRSILFALTLASLGCSSQPQPHSAAPENLLALRLVVVPNPIKPGEELAGSFVVTSNAETTLHVCKTGDWESSPTAGIPVRGISHTHTGCGDADWVAIEPGRSVEWREKIGTLPECIKPSSASSETFESDSCPGEHSLKAHVLIFVAKHDRCSRRHPCTTIWLEAKASYIVR
jgi:hypothetical protein